MGVPNSDQFVLKQNNEAAKREGIQDHFRDWGTHRFAIQFHNWMQLGSVPNLPNA